MSYTTLIKNEIVTNELSKPVLIALLSGFIRCNAVITDRQLQLTTENLKTADYIARSLYETYEEHVVLKVRDYVNFNKKKLYVLVISEKTEMILQDTGYFDKNKKKLPTPPDYIVDGDEEIRAYLKGVFLTSGSVNDPKTSQYHMELSFYSSDEAVYVQKILNSFNLNAKLLMRDKSYMVYLKEAEKISDYLRILGANKAVMYFEDIRIYRDKKNQANRLNNCEQANTDKIFGAAALQLEHIQIIEENLGTALLDDKTKEALEYRKKYPEASLKELSEIINIETGNKLTKSGLNHRFRKIKELAEKF